MIGRPGKWPARYHSSGRTRLRATTRAPGSRSTTSSSRRNGSRWGKIASISALVRDDNPVSLVATAALTPEIAEPLLRGRFASISFLVRGLNRVSLWATAALTPEIAEPLLRGRFGRPYVYFEQIDSTQRALPVDAPEGAVAVAEEQTAGRGRLGRSWYAPPRTSVLVSINLRPQIDSARLPELSLIAGAAAAEAIAAETGLDPEVRFPNDVLIGGRKVAGILAEARDGRGVLGIGINATTPLDELPEPAATSLLVATGEPVDRARLLAALLERLEAHYDR